MKISFDDRNTVERARAVSQCVKAISHEIRLAIVFSLRTGEKNVSALVTRIGCSQPTLSQHLGIMRDRGILLTRRVGSQTYYRVADKRVFKIMDLIKAVFCK